MSESRPNEGRKLKVALLSSCTIDLLQGPLGAGLGRDGWQPEFRVGGFAQYRQDILNPDSTLYAFAPDIVILYLDGEDLFSGLLQNPFDHDADRRQTMAQTAVAEIDGLVRNLAERLPGATVLLNTTVLSPKNTLAGLEYNSSFSLRDVISLYNSELGALARRTSNAVIVDVESLVTWTGYARWSDPRLWHLARMRLSREALQLLAEAYASAINSRYGRTRKCLVLDLDGTLWGGVVGEVGMAGIQLGEEGPGSAYKEFQAELLNLSRKGILLAVSSKNNPADALEVIRSHRSMLLRENCFAAMRINWEDKAANIRAIAQELNIGLDSLVFIDDSPVERTWVRQALPDVLVPEWPADASDFKGALLDLEGGPFLKLNVTAEDRERGSLYHAQARRKLLEKEAGSLEDFYRSLEMRCIIEPANALLVPRISQLTQKTNQFNLTTRRYTEAEIGALIHDPRQAVYSLELVDRFGSNGLVGVLILKNTGPGTWAIDTFLLSCRVIGRTVESAFLGFVCGELKKRGAERLIGEFRPTAKNKLVGGLFKELGFRLVEEGEGGSFWELGLEGDGVRVPPWFEITYRRDKERS